MYQQAFHGIADAVAAGFGVDDYGAGFVGVGVGVDVDVAIAVEVLEHGDARMLEYGFDEGAAAARDDKIEVGGLR